MDDSCENHILDSNQPLDEEAPAFNISNEDQSDELEQPQLEQEEPRQLTNSFMLLDEEKKFINKRLPRGFCLIKPTDMPRIQRPFITPIEFIPQPRSLRTTNEDFAKQANLQGSQLRTEAQIRNNQQSIAPVQRPTLRPNTQLPEGKSRQTQKIKQLLQRLRKHPKYLAICSQLGKIGFQQGISQIEAQIRHNLHTIDSFKARCMFLFNSVKECAFSKQDLQLVNEIIDDFNFYVEQSRKQQFESNLQLIQGGIDKITRQITNIKQTGSWYFRRKKKSEKPFDDRELMHLGDLIRSLSRYHLAGVWEIIEEKPFSECQGQELVFDLQLLKVKKQRELEYYVKRKLSLIHRSRAHKLAKREKAKQQLLQQEQKPTTNAQKQQGIKTDPSEIPNAEIGVNPANIVESNDFTLLNMQLEAQISSQLLPEEAGSDPANHHQIIEEEEQQQLINGSWTFEDVVASNYRPSGSDGYLLSGHHVGIDGPLPNKSSPHDYSMTFGEVDNTIREPVVLPQQVHQEDLSSDPSFITDEEDSDA